VSLSRLEWKNVLNHIRGVDTIDPDVLAKIVALAGAPAALPIALPPMHVATMEAEKHQRDAFGFSIDASGPPPYVPVVYSDAQLEKLWVEDANAPDGKRHPTQADVAEINEQKCRAQEAEWNAQQQYRPNINPEAKRTDLVAFAEPDRIGNRFDRTPVGAKNRVGDVCVRLEDGRLGAETPVFACINGHGYSQNGILPGCPQCEILGIQSTVQSDEDAPPDSRRGARDDDDEGDGSVDDRW
jgi:hypothetical protein